MADPTIEKAADLTADQARTLLRYEPETGRLFWLPRPREIFKTERDWKIWSTRYADKEAFTARNDQGYRQGLVFGRQYGAHRLIWLLQTGSWPDRQVDHINGVRDDNRWANLRAASISENGRNQKRPSNNTSGVIGVYWREKSKKWCASIGVDGQKIHLGHFATLEAAAAARAAANTEHGFSLRHGEDVSIQSAMEKVDV